MCGTEGIWEIFVSSSFVVNLKLLLKIKSKISLHFNFLSCFMTVTNANHPGMFSSPPFTDLMQAHAYKFFFQFIQMS